MSVYLQLTDGVLRCPGVPRFLRETVKSVGHCEVLARAHSFNIFVKLHLKNEIKIFSILMYVYF